jgi:phenylalanyl-tRNA synthetase beta chain
MKIPLSWLRDYLDFEASADTVAEKLTMLGLEVESVLDRGKSLAGFIVAEVVEARPHPDADRLRVCRVFTGADTLDVVCGAPNARTGMKGVFAGVGLHIPGTGIDLKKTKIRGVESNGMLLSEREMGLSDEHAGIVDLPSDAPVGASAAMVMGLDDPVIDVAITPNRGDCLGIRGIARELAAGGVGRLKPLAASPVPGTFKSPIDVTLAFDPAEAHACPYFVGRLVRGVVNGESPKWLKDRLAAVGLRPISALVDITNYMTIGLNRPLHVFDAAKISGGLTVRLAKDGERLAALNDKEYALDSEMTVIADNQDALALGGVIGGETSGCSASTRDVFIESAYFDLIRTAATGRKLNIISDARYRFERGIDPAFVIDGLEIATRMVQDLCGGDASERVVAGAPPPPPKSIRLRPDRVQKLGGLDLPSGQSADILAKLGFAVERSVDAVTATPPTWRHDIVGEACLVEEVVRIAGYDRVPAIAPVRTDALPAPSLSPVQRRRYQARRRLAARGMIEAVTFSFLPRAQADLFGGVAETLILANPISADLDSMRPSLLPNLIAAAGRNADRGIEDAALFEVGPAFQGTQPGEQQIVAAGLRAGRISPRDWAQKSRVADVFDAKADVLAVLAELGLPAGAARLAADAPDWYHPGRSGTFRIASKSVLAQFGEINPRVLAAMGVKGPMVGFEVFLDNGPKPKAKASAARPPLVLSQYQAVERDFAFVMGDDIAADTVIAAAKGAVPELVSTARVFDVFVGEAVGEGRKSLGVSVVLQPTKATLTEDEIEAAADKIVRAVAERTGAELRRS